MKTDFDLFRAVLSRLNANLEDKVNVRCRLRGLDGAWHWFDAEARRHPQRDEAGIVVSLLEITDLQRMEAERQVIVEVIHALNETSNLDQLLHHIHQSLKKVLYAENCFIAMHDAETRIVSIFRFSPIDLTPRLRRRKLAEVARRSCFAPAGGC